MQMQGAPLEPVAAGVDAAGTSWLSSISTEWYLATLVAITSAGWALILFYRDYRQRLQDKSIELIKMLIETDRQHMQNPSVHMYMSEHALEPVEFFRDAARLQEQTYFKAKSAAYAMLNFFDSLTANSRTSWIRRLIRAPRILEIHDWENYMIEKLRHPLYRSILEKEMHIFGAALRDFWKKNQTTILSEPADPHMW